MQFTWNPLPFMPYQAFINNYINIFFMSYDFNNIFTDGVCFFNLFIIYNSQIIHL